MANQGQNLLAVLIDADNIRAKYAAPILAEIKALGTPALRRVYGDWSSDQLNGWKSVVADLGMVAHQETANTTGKNASDIGLVIDAMDILHTGRFDGFVLVSSDSDFTALANRVRENGLEVIGVGERKTPDSLRNACTRFILIENIISDTADKDGGVKADADSKQKPENAGPLFIQAMDKIEQEDEWYSMSQMGLFIRASHPDFDPRTYGHKKLSDLAKVLKGFETRKTGNLLQLRRRKKS